VSILYHYHLERRTTLPQNKARHTKDMIRLFLSTCLATPSVADVFLVFIGLEKILVGAGSLTALFHPWRLTNTEGGDDVGAGEPVV
jgi:hypothetical protein